MNPRARARILFVAAVTAVVGAVGAGTSSAAAYDPLFDTITCPDCHDLCLYDDDHNEIVCIPMQWPPV